MTDTQLLTLAITLLAIFIAMLVNNHRMTDLRTDVGLSHLGPCHTVRSALCGFLTND